MKKVGRGVACMWYGIWGAASTAIVKVDIGGTVTLVTGEVDIGQGLNTIFRQIVAEEIGVPLETVRIISASDSEITPNSGGAGASRSTYMGGNAVRQAAAEAKKIILSVAAELFHVPVQAIELKDGKIYVKNAPEKSLSLAEITRSRPPIVASGSSESSTTPMDTETGQGNPFHIYVYATQIADVEVDTETGMVKVLKILPPGFNTDTGSNSTMSIPNSLAISPMPLLSAAFRAGPSMGLSPIRGVAPAPCTRRATDFTTRGWVLTHVSGGRPIQRFGFNSTFSPGET